jgi:hypothetical protein
MTTAQKLARYGAAFALALTVIATAAPTLAFADEEGGYEESGYDPNSAPLVLDVVNGGIQTAAGATEFGLGIGQAASGEEGLGIGAAGTEVGAEATGFGIGIPAAIVSGQP